MCWSGECEDRSEKTYYSGEKVASSPKQANTQPGCKSKCQDISECTGWSWSKASKECRMFEKIETIVADTVSGNICDG